jgi:hypothetical protein
MKLIARNYTVYTAITIKDPINCNQRERTWVNDKNKFWSISDKSPENRFNILPSGVESKKLYNL